MATMSLQQLTRPRLISICRTLQTERDRAIRRAAFWRDRHTEACHRLNQHVCDQMCSPSNHHDCPPEICEWNGCECPCHDLEENGTHEPGVRR